MITFSVSKFSWLSSHYKMYKIKKEISRNLSFEYVKLLTHDDHVTDGRNMITLYNNNVITRDYYFMFWFYFIILSSDRNNLLLGLNGAYGIIQGLITMVPACFTNA